MTVRQQIIDRVNSIQNPMILNQILNLIKVEAEFGEIYKFNEKEKKSLEKGLADIDAGRVYSKEGAKKMVSRWLQEKSNGL